MTTAVPAADATRTYEGIPGVGDIVSEKFEVEKVIGAGGMGVVVAARHLTLGERVAIKFLLPKASRDKESIARFMREARATARIKNEHVVRVTDAGLLASGAPYILMEYLEGQDLAHLVHDGGPLSADLAVDYVLQACEALAEAHSIGIVHRDLKPSNLFASVRSDGTTCIKVLDFGISKALPSMTGTHDPNLTDTQAIFGSPAYMSPEQVRSSKRVDRRTDIWALGVILYELLTGDSPFVGEEVSGLIASIIADEPKPITRQDLSPRLVAVVLRCLEKDVSRRIQSIAELATALVPHSSPGSQPSVERIQRFSNSKAPPSAPSVPSEPVSGPLKSSLSFAETERSWGTQGLPIGRRAASRARNVTLVGAAFAVILAVSIGYAIRPAGPPAQGSPALEAPSAATLAASPGATIPVAMATAPPASSAPTASAVLSAPASSVAIAPPVALPAPPREDPRPRPPAPVRALDAATGPAPAVTSSASRFDTDRK